MDLRQLEYFVRVAELGSFTRAAIELSIAQPALSRQVRLLEVELRQNLLTRNGRGAIPTEAGRMLLEHARGILHQVDHAREDLGRLRGGTAGRVALGLPHSVARVLTVPLTRAFRERLPEAQVSISEGLSTQLLTQLTSGRLDIALVYNPMPARDLDIQHVLDEDLVLVRGRPRGLSEDPAPGPVGLRELARLPLVMPTRPNALRMHLESELAALGLSPQVVLEIDGVLAILDLVHDGAGCAVLSRNALLHTTRPSEYTVQSIGEPPLRVRLSMATSLQRPSTSVQRTTRELIFSLAGRLFPGQ